MSRDYESVDKKKESILGYVTESDEKRKVFKVLFL